MKQYVNLPQKDYYTKENARVIDQYSISENNCTTVISDVLNQAGSNVLLRQRVTPSLNATYYKDRFIMPASLQKYLIWKSMNKSSNVIMK